MTLLFEPRLMRLSLYTTSTWRTIRAMVRPKLEMQRRMTSRRRRLNCPLSSYTRKYALMTIQLSFIFLRIDNLLRRQQTRPEKFLRTSSIFGFGWPAYLAAVWLPFDLFVLVSWLIVWWTVSPQRPFLRKSWRFVCIHRNTCAVRMASSAFSASLVLGKVAFTIWQWTSWPLITSRFPGGWQPKKEP